MLQILFLLAPAFANFNQFEFVQVTSQHEYLATTFQGVITLVQNNVFLWRCDDLEEAIPNIKFTILERGTVLKLSDFNTQYGYTEKPFPQFVFEYQDQNQGQLIIDYITYNNPTYEEKIKKVISENIIQEFTVDWTDVHDLVFSLKDQLQQFCKRHIKIEL